MTPGAHRSAGVPMREPNDENVNRPLRVGSLFSGYRGLDLAVEHATGGETIWFSEIDAPPIRVFTRHWAGTPHLGDISVIDLGDDGAADRCADQRAPGSGGLGRRHRRRPLTRHPLRALVEHGSRDRRVATRARHHGERPRLALRTPNPPYPGRNNPRRTQPNDATDEPAPAVPNLEPDPWPLGDEPTRPPRAHGATLGDLADLRRSAR